MLLKSNVFRLILSFCLVLCVGVAAFADTIRLKDGSVIKGRIVGFRDGQFLVQIGDGARSRQMTFFADEIDAIEFDPTSAPSNNAVRNVVTGAPVTALPKPTLSQTPNPQSVAGNDGVKIVVGQGDSNPTPDSQTSVPNTNPANNSNQINRPTGNTTTGPNPVSTSTTQNPIRTSNASTTSTSAKPSISLKVLADNTANGWTNSGFMVKKGQKIRISGAGRISLGNGNYSTPSGLSSLADKDKLMPKEATGGLIAVVGDDNNDFVFIGGLREFTATRDGALFLGINEGVLDDNSGAFDVVIVID